MSGHTSRSRSPSTGPNGRQHSPSFGQGQNNAMDPSLFNSSVYQAGANYQNPAHFLNAGQMSQGFGIQDMSGQGMNDFAFEGKNGMINGGGLLVDPALENGNSVNPTDIMGNMSPQDTMSPTSGLGSGIGSQHHSPALAQTGFSSASPAHSRHHSLDPSSAGIGQGHASEWIGHRRSPSDQSDVSSAAHSPYQPSADFSDNFDASQNHSPMLNPSNDPGLFQDDMSRFTISDAQHRASLSQQNSPYISPSLVPAPVNGGLPEGQFVLPSNVQQEPFIPSDIGQADTMMPPSIHVEPAPPGFVVPQPGSDNNNNNNGGNEALSPPQRGRMGRNRAKSDTSLGPGPISRPLSPNDLTPNFAPQPGMLNADINQPQRHRSLSPFDATFPANYRSSSPGSARSSRRSSTSSINPNRDYILELADPNRPSANPSGTRVQKHPATFQCTMCPKRFTRAYNLRSHLRTHTDERPFVCSVCGKAFARQHDRKRHEGLHSGEKKFVCKGDLANGAGQWGCGRRFARADALGRHFRSEAGRVCIKPLLDEEIAEKRRQYEQSVISGAGIGPHNMGQMPPGGMPPPPSGVLPSQGPGVDLSMGQGVGAVGAPAGFALPQAILAQYPALQGLQWDQIGSGPVGGDDDGGLSGRSSFDASGEVYDDEDGYLSGPGTAYGQSGWASDQGGM